MGIEGEREQRSSDLDAAQEALELWVVVEHHPDLFYQRALTREREPVTADT